MTDAGMTGRAFIRLPAIRLKDNGAQQSLQG